MRHGRGARLYEHTLDEVYATMVPFGMDEAHILIQFTQKHGNTGMTIPVLVPDALVLANELVRVLAKLRDAGVGGFGEAR